VTRAALNGLAVLVLGFLVAPILAVVPLSFSSGELLTLPVPGYSLRWYEEFFANPRWLEATRNSLVVGVATVLVATPLGTLAALGLAFGRVPGRALWLAVLATPMVAPVIVSAVAMYFGFARLGLAGTLPGLILAHAVLALPYVVVTVLAALQGFDPALLRAAASLGAPPALAFRRVVLPLVAPGIGAGAIFAFATSFDELVVALFMAGPGQFTLPRQMYAGVHENLSPTICAAAVMLVLCSLALLGVSEWLRGRAAAARGAGRKVPA
jgi:putative spermidine/putrescine transport system permease protein